MTKPVLYVFLISHYCEKARWALDLFDIDHEVTLLSPMTHAKTAKLLGVDSTSLPILQTSAGVVQGSSEIVLWAKENSQKLPNTKLTISDESIEIEKRLDGVLGVHVRRWFYSESLIDCPETVRPVFAEGSGWASRLVLKLAWPKVVAIMTKKMDLGPKQEIQSRSIVIDELDWLDSLLEDGRPYLAGETLSNADIAAASLLAPMFAPDKHPASDHIILPPRLMVTVQEWTSRRFAKHLAALYQDFR